MNNTSVVLDQTEEEILTSEVSDSALEAAAGKGNENAAANTVIACTGLMNCPGY